MSIFQFNFSKTSVAQNKMTTVAPTFEDLSIDDSLPYIERIVRYTQSSIALQRVVHVKMIAEVAKSVGFEETNEHIIPLCNALAKDAELAVRQNLCEQFTSLSKFCYSVGGSEGYRVVLQVILPIIAKLLLDDKNEVREKACLAMVNVAALVKPEDLGQYVLTIVLRLAHEDEDEEMRMTACELLNMLVENLGYDLCKQFVIPEIVSLAEDPNFRVRKATALNFQNICKVGGEHELFERLMPAFVRLSKDDMYRVRRSCGESLAVISMHVSDDIRSGVLIEIFLRLAQDTSKLVKQSVLQQSGMFISTLPRKAVTDVILGHFISLANNPTGDGTVDAELKHHCAYSFPGVLQTIGVERWPEVRQIYHKLVQSQSYNVKITLALSLHEIAKILGPGPYIEEDLVAVFEEMIQDVEAVRMGVLKHLAEFLSLLSEPCRISYLPMLNDMLHSTNPFNWRLRQIMAMQLPDLMSLPPKNNVYNTLFPLSMTLLQDPVAEVRKKSFRGIAKMILVLQGGGEEGDPPVASGGDAGEDPGTDGENSEEYVEAVCRAINALTYGDTYQHRQLWVELCHQLLRDLPWQLFEKYFVEGLVRLSNDRVLNVRITVAILLGGWAPDHKAPWEDANCNSSISGEDGQPVPSPWTPLMNRQDIRDCVIRMSTDDNDVLRSLSNLQPLFPDVTFASATGRGSMKSTPVNSLALLPKSASGNDDDDLALSITADDGLEKDPMSPASTISSVESTEDFERRMIADDVMSELIDSVTSTLPLSTSTSVTSSVADKVEDIVVHYDHNTLPVPPPPYSLLTTSRQINLSTGSIDDENSSHDLAYSSVSFPDGNESVVVVASTSSSSHMVQEQEQEDWQTVEAPNVVDSNSYNLVNEEADISSTAEIPDGDLPVVTLLSEPSFLENTNSNINNHLEHNITLFYNHDQSLDDHVLYDDGTLDTTTGGGEDGTIDMNNLEDTEELGIGQVNTLSTESNKSENIAYDQEGVEDNNSNNDNNNNNNNNNESMMSDEISSSSDFSLHKNETGLVF